MKSMNEHIMGFVKNRIPKMAEPQKMLPPVGGAQVGGRMNKLSPAYISRAFFIASKRISLAAKKADKSWSKFLRNFSQRGLARLVLRTRKTSGALSKSFGHAAARISSSWNNALGGFGKAMGKMTKFSLRAGIQIAKNMAKGTASAGMFGAKGIGKAARGGFRGAKAVGKVAVHGARAAGQSVAMAGMAAGTIGAALEEKSPKVAKLLMQFAQVAIVVGAVGEVFAALIAVFNPATLVIAAVAGAAFLVYLAFKKIPFVHDAVMATISGLTTAWTWFAQFLPQPIKKALDWIVGAWNRAKEFISGFIKHPVKVAEQVAQQLINALNHNPTEKIPDAWEGAVERICNFLNIIPGFGTLIAESLKKIFSPDSIFGGFVEYAKNMLDQLSKSGLGSFLGGMIDKLKAFLSGMGKEDNPADVVTGAVLDYSEQLKRAIQLAKSSGASKDVVQQLQSALDTNEGGNFVSLPGK